MACKTVPVLEVHLARRGSENAKGFSAALSSCITNQHSFNCGYRRKRGRKVALIKNREEEKTLERSCWTDWQGHCSRGLMCAVVRSCFFESMLEVSWIFFSFTMNSHTTTDSSCLNTIAFQPVFSHRQANDNVHHDACWTILAGAKMCLLVVENPIRMPQVNGEPNKHWRTKKQNKTQWE